MTANRAQFALWIIVAGLANLQRLAFGQVSVGSDGHFIQHDGRLQILVGDSGTQCVLQNLNLDYRRWIDDCAKAGLNAVHVWSFLAPRQRRDGSLLEKRYGYVYPGVTPWQRRRGGPLAADGLPRWDLTRFDEGEDPDQHYWPRLRDLCRYAKARGLAVGISVFFGWPKHNTRERPDWLFHPFNRAAGGHLTERRPIVEVVQHIAAPGTELLDRPWSEARSPAAKTQWVWEQFADKLVTETQSFDNTFFVFMDERSYSEGNCGDHFARFFRRRGAFWIDGQIRRHMVDGVVNGHGPGRDLNRAAGANFGRLPARPLFEFESPPYRGDAVRHNLYACLLGGGHYFFHNDEGQETVTTGIMGYDPNVRNCRMERVHQRQRHLGIAARLLNQEVRQLRGMQPHNRLIRQGRGFCLARPGEEYVIYIEHGSRALLSLPEPVDRFELRLLSPRTGESKLLTTAARGTEVELRFPDDGDWVVHIATKGVR